MVGKSLTIDSHVHYVPREVMLKANSISKTLSLYNWINPNFPLHRSLCEVGSLFQVF